MNPPTHWFPLSPNGERTPPQSGLESKPRTQSSPSSKPNRPVEDEFENEDEDEDEDEGTVHVRIRSANGKLFWIRACVGSRFH